MKVRAYVCACVGERKGERENKARLGIGILFTFMSGIMLRTIPSLSGVTVKVCGEMSIACERVNVFILLVFRRNRHDVRRDAHDG